MAHVAGKYGTVTLNSVPLRVTSWSGDYTTELIETSDSGSNGFRERVAGFTELSVTIECNFDSATVTGDPPFPHSLSGQSVPVVLEVNDENDTALLTLSCNLMIENIPLSLDVLGGVTYSISGVSNGAITVS